MAKAQITFKYNNETGKRDIHIDYESDPSSLPFEHEDDHRQLVDRLIDLNAVAEEKEAMEVSRQEAQTEGQVTQPEEEKERLTRPPLQQKRKK